MRRITTKRALIALACAGVLALAAGAYAYFSSTGSGTATATVGSASAVTIKATVSSTLYPGSSSPVTFTIDNPSSGKERVATISLTEVKADAGHSTCSTTISGGNPDFAMAAVAVNQSFGPGNNQSVTPTGTLTMNDTGVSQDACQGATLTLKLASN